MLSFLLAACWLGDAVTALPTMALSQTVRKIVSPAARSLRRASKKEWDYIIVGGGTAGCVLANRLSADPSVSVLVVEAGTASPTHPLVKIPVAILKLFKSKWDWDYATEPSSSVAGRSIYLCRGKGLGGSSNINVMLYNRGSRSDYDGWAQASGDASWNGAAMLEYFKRAEDCKSSENAGVGEWHGDQGPAAVSDVPYQNPMSAAFLEAAGSQHPDAFGLNADFNDWSKAQTGFGRFQVSQRKGSRESAYTAYMTKAVKNRPNLEILVGAAAQRLVFDADKVAVGVRFAVRGAAGQDLADETVRLSTRGEVLLASGAIGSPQLLMLSGVGPSAELASHDIEVVAAREGVGANLQDHPACLVSHFGSEKAKGLSHSSKLRVPGTTLTSPKAALTWALKGEGPLTSPGCDHGGFVRVGGSSEDDADAPNADDDGGADVQFRFLATKSITPDGMSTISGGYQAQKDHPDGITIQAIVARPKSRATLKLRSRDPHDAPLIEDYFFSDARDVATMVAALKKGREIMLQPALSEFRGAEEFPGAAVQTDAQLAAYVRATAHTANAIVGTCKMGRHDDARAVVDSQLKVIGVHKVRVVDASIMPSLPGGQTAASTIAIAEKAADLLQLASSR